MREMTIVQYVAAPFWGGGEQYIYNIAKSLITEYGVQFVFVCHENSEEELLLRFQQLGTVYKINPQTKNGKFSFLSAIKLAHIVRKHQAHIVHVHNNHNYFVAVYAKVFLLGKLKIIATQHLVAQAKNKVSWLFAYRLIDKFIFVSQIVQEHYLSQERVKRNCRHFTVIRSSVNVNECDDNGCINLRKTYSIPDNYKIILFHGRICAEKGIIQLIKTFDKLKELPFYVVLAGEVFKSDAMYYETELARSSIKDRILNIGFCKNIFPLIRQADFGIIPSIVPEAGSLSLIENIAMGKAVIASNNGSQKEFLIDGVSGLLCEPNNEEQWINAMRKLLIDDSFCAKIGENAKKSFDEQFNFKSFAKKIYELYI